MVIPVTASTFIVNGEEAPDEILVCRVAVCATVGNKATVSVPFPLAAEEPNCPLDTTKEPLPSGAE